jgi:hypothetical protein
MDRLLKSIAGVESATGVALLITPATVARLLLGTGLDSLSDVLARVTGIALFSLGVACWPRRGITHGSSGLLTYGLLVTVYLVYLGIRGEWVGALLWPAAAAHALLTALLARSAFRGRYEPSC